MQVFNIQHQSVGGGEMTVSVDGGRRPPGLSLVQLYMRQKSLSAEGMSTGMDLSSASERSSEAAATTAATRDPIRESASAAYSFDKCFHNNNNISSSSVEKVRPSCHHSSATSVSSDNTDSTRIHARPATQLVLSKHNATQFPVHLINRSMQTSALVDSSALRRSGSGAPYKLLKCAAAAVASDHPVRVVEPSFLSKLKRESDSQQKPVYVVYPNYTLPDLGFLKEKQEDVTRVYLMPHKYAAAAGDERRREPRRNRRPVAASSRGRRPFSCNDMEALKKKGFGHIRDWDSLTFLLPAECRQVLADVPEFMDVMRDREAGQELLRAARDRPLFCASPPPLRPKRTRPVSCDYTSQLDNNRYNNVTNVSSSSSTATQPSSGYRGSSTMLLTDSSQNGSPAAAGNTFNPLFVYRYDSVTSSEASSMASEGRQQVTAAAGTGGAAPPLPKRSISLPTAAVEQQQPPPPRSAVPPRPPLPRGILRNNLDCKLRKNIHNNRYATTCVLYTSELTNSHCL